jgi:hypothetical protein
MDDRGIFQTKLTPQKWLTFFLTEKEGNKGEGELVPGEVSASFSRWT